LLIGAQFGIRHFGTNSGATIYQSLNQVNVLLNGTPPAPAKPVQ
jgi:hypothetical protein